MAFNIKMDSRGQPKRGESELFILKRQGIEYEIKKETGSSQQQPMHHPFTKGHLLLTSHRLILLTDPSTISGSVVQSYEIPLIKVSKEKFEQPMLGTSYYRGNV